MKKIKILLLAFGLFFLASCETTELGNSKKGLWFPGTEIKNGEIPVYIEGGEVLYVKEFPSNLTRKKTPIVIFF